MHALPFRDLEGKEVVAKESPGRNLRINFSVEIRNLLIDNRRRPNPS
jgi:hypothetical protein